jgi:hypothetical protein
MGRVARRLRFARTDFEPAQRKTTLALCERGLCNQRKAIRRSEGKHQIELVEA